MANDLVRYEGEAGDKATEGGGVESEDSFRGTMRRRKHGYSAEVADLDARDARRRRDYQFAVQREEDAREHRQKQWDWGDSRTWLILFGLFWGGLILTLSAYFLPQGQHASAPTIRVY